MDSTQRQLVVITVGVVVLTASIGYAATMGPHSPPIPGLSTAPDTGAPSTAVERLHVANYTGDDVKVGIIDVTGFATTQAPIADQVVATRSFGTGGRPVGDGRTTHGTATATVVARTAPDAELYLTDFDTAAEFRRGIAWLLQQDVDVIVAPVSFFGRPGDGSSPVSQAVTQAARQGVVFVAAAGNIGEGHWQGQFNPVGDGSHRFDNGTRNYLLDANGPRDRIVLWLSWDRSARQQDFTVELYTPEDDSVRLVARSQPYRADSTPNERIVATVDPDGTYYVVLRGPEKAAGTRVEITSPTHRLATQRRRGSLVAPGTARSIITVGAYNTSTESIEPFSAAGATSPKSVVDPRQSTVDLVADDRFTVDGRSFGGTSASAAYVGGVAALVIDAAPAADADDVRWALRTTATDVGASGVDSVAGYGRIRPVRAIQTLWDRLAN